MFQLILAVSLGGVGVQKTIYTVYKINISNQRIM